MAHCVWRGRGETKSQSGDDNAGAREAANMQPGRKFARDEWTDATDGTGLVGDERCGDIELP